jgi:hypothetical protein
MMDSRLGIERQGLRVVGSNRVYRDDDNVNGIQRLILIESRREDHGCFSPQQRYNHVEALSWDLGLAIRKVQTHLEVAGREPSVPRSGSRCL